MGRRGEGLLRAPKGSTTNSASSIRRRPAPPQAGDKVGAYQSFEKGREANVSCACHWTVNVAASAATGKLFADAYSVSPARLFVPPNSPIRKPEDLADVPISVGYQSGSHYSTIQALEQYLPREEIKLSFADGMLFSRLELLIDRKVPAARCSAGRTTSSSSSASARSSTHLHDGHDGHRRSRPRGRQEVFPRAAPAQHDIDLDPSSTRTSTAGNSRCASTSRWIRGAGARASGSCSSPTRATFEESFDWIAEREIFPAGRMGSGDTTRPRCRSLRARRSHTTSSL